MAKYTTELYKILNSSYSDDYLSVSDISNMLDTVRGSFFDFYYPSEFMTEDEKASFEKHFLQHYLYNEIGFETVGMFKNRLVSKLWDIMPYYNELYKTIHFDIDYFNDYRIETNSNGKARNDADNSQTGKIKNTSVTNSESKNTGDTINLQSDTPQSNIDIASNDFVSAVGKNIDNTKNNTIATTEAEQSFDEYHNKTYGMSETENKTITLGNNGNNSEKLKKYRDNILNIEMMIIKDCASLFMKIW